MSGYSPRMATLGSEDCGQFPHPVQTVKMPRVSEYKRKTNCMSCMSCLRFTTHDCDSVKAIHLIAKFGLFPSSQDTIQLPRDLGEIGEFQDLPPEPLEELSKLMKLRLYVPQQVILQQGLVDLELMGPRGDPKNGLQLVP